MQKLIKKFKSLCITTKTCTPIQNFKRNYLENYNDSEHTVTADQTVQKVATSVIETKIIKNVKK